MTCAGGLSLSLSSRPGPSLSTGTWDKCANVPVSFFFVFFFLFPKSQGLTSAIDTVSFSVLSEGCEIVLLGVAVIFAIEPIPPAIPVHRVRNVVLPLLYILFLTFLIYTHHSERFLDTTSTMSLTK